VFQPPTASIYSVASPTHPVSPVGRSALKRVEMVETIPPWVAVHDFRFGHAGPDHFLGNFRVVGPFLFPFLAVYADRLMIVDRENASIIGL
jgi:hypothetical protein